MTRRVVITGMGTINPLGNDVETTWKNLLSGQCGIEKTELFDASTFPTQFSAEIKDFSFWDKLPDRVKNGHGQSSSPEQVHDRRGPAGLAAGWFA